jgi:hypothetical protein
MYCDCKTKVAEISNQILTERISKKLAKHSTLEKYFLDFMIENHGALFAKEHFKDCNGTVHRIGRLVNFVDDISEISLPNMEDWEGGGDDLRLRYSIYCLESMGNVQDGMGDTLLPAGILYTGENHPDEEVTQHSNMLALDMSKPGVPEVFVWNNDKAVKEYYHSQNEGKEINYKKFTTLVAENFENFIKLLY